MTIDIKKAGREALIHERLRSGVFHDVDELLTLWMLSTKSVRGGS